MLLFLEVLAHRGHLQVFRVVFLARGNICEAAHCLLQLQDFAVDDILVSFIQLRCPDVWHRTASVGFGVTLVRLGIVLLVVAFLDVNQVALLLDVRRKDTIRGALRAPFFILFLLVNFAIFQRMKLHLWLFFTYTFFIENILDVSDSILF